MDAPLQRVQLTEQLELWQRKQGHRTGTDDVLCAWAGSVVAPAASAILDLGSVLTIMFYYFVACGLMSVQLFGGRLAQRCQDGDSGEWLIDTYYDNCGLPGTMGRQCDEIASELWAAGEYPPNATAAILAANATGELITPFVANVSCVSTWGMPSVEEFFKADDLLKFDSIGWAVLTLFLCMSGVGWTDVMYKLIDVRGWPVAIYFTLFVTAGMWGVTNLLVAVLSPCDLEVGAFRVGHGREGGLHDSIERNLEDLSYLFFEHQVDGRPCGSEAPQAGRQDPQVSARTGYIGYIYIYIWSPPLPRPMYFAIQAVFT